MGASAPTPENVRGQSLTDWMRSIESDEPSVDLFQRQRQLHDRGMVSVGAIT